MVATQRPQTFQEVLTAAIDDLMLHGFDSVERVERWTRELREAARRSLVSEASLEQQMRDGLAAIYKRMVDKGGLFKFNPGIERFTLERVRPALRGELDRRIMASANLIKLNRSQAIEKTLQRFQGWSTSIPAGGTDAVKKGETKKDVRKSLASLPFEERRVLIDQGHKLVSSLNNILAADGGAIAMQWSSKWRQPGYNYRPDHKERDGKVYLIRDSWAHKAGLIKKGRPGYLDEITQPAEEVFCRCSGVYLYNLRDLPEEMLTQAGRRKMVEVGLHWDATRAFARADSAGNLISQAKAEYISTWANRPTRCARCTMFLEQKTDPMTGRCTAVAGAISAHGHCKLFESVSAVHAA